MTATLAEQPLGPVLPRGYRTVPPHGSYSRYTIFKCRCADCRTVVAQYRRRATRQRAYNGGRTLILTDEETAPLRERSRTLIEKGWDQKALARRADLAQETFGSFYTGRKKNPTLKTAKRIEAMLDQVEAETRTPAQRCRDQLNILNGMGWTIAQIAEVAETGANLSQIVNGHQDPWPITIERVQAAWDRLTGPGPKPPRQDLKGRASERIRGAAETPEAPARRVPVEDAARLIEQLQKHRGYSDGTLSIAAGVTARTIFRIRHRRVDTVHDDTMTLLEELAHQEGITP